MFNSFIPFIPVVMPFIILSIVWFFLFLIRRHYRKKGLRLPFTNRFLRSPGQSLIEEIEVINEKLTEYMMFVLFFPTAGSAMYIPYLYVKRVEVTFSDVGVVGGVISVTIVFCLYRIYGLLGRRRRARLGYDGEVAVGQELNQLLRDGYYVYHDFPADKFNIDHIVVGRKGIFAIETKARSKPTSDQRQTDATVEYDGRMLRFPKYTDTQILEQAKRQAKWLSTWISSAIGEDVAARAVVALPGWFVKRTSPDGIPVVNPGQFTSLFEHIGPRDLSDKMIRRIVHQIEQKCRDIDPVSAIYEEEKV